MFLYIMFQVGSMISFDDIFGICPDSPLLRCFGLPWGTTPSTWKPQTVCLKRAVYASISKNPWNSKTKQIGRSLGWSMKQGFPILKMRKVWFLDLLEKLGGGFKYCSFYFHPENWGRFPFWLIFFKGVETTNQKDIQKRARTCRRGKN